MRIKTPTGEEHCEGCPLCCERGCRCPLIEGDLDATYLRRLRLQDQLNSEVGGGDGD